MTETVVRTTREAGVLWLAFNRPDKLNALNIAMTVELIDALRAAEHDPDVRVIVISGIGRGFCSGQDLEDFQERYERDEPIDVAHHLRTTYNVVASLLRSIEKPVIASVNGYAAGFGVSLALACDLRIAAQEAKFTLGFSRIGLVPDGSGSLLLPVIVGLGRAFELALLSERIDAREAHRVGLVNRVVPLAELQPATQALADQLAAMPAPAMAFTKRAFNRAMLPGFAAWLDEEADLQHEASLHPDHREGVKAFLEKRAPAFSGR
jgi:2-(1,2-epoxy-1,2-dihydrophenyl)acetyl-CoA isomerase